VSSWCSPETSCHTSSSNSSTSKLCLILRRGWAQRMEMLPTLRENSPSSKHLQEQSSTIWWTNTCQRHNGTTTLRPHSSMALGARPPPFSLKGAIYSQHRAPGSWRGNDSVAT
jgi:hypothetical protein